MQKMSKIVSAIVSTAFLLNTVAADLAFSQPINYRANSDKLAPPLTLNHDAGRIRVILQFILATDIYDEDGNVDIEKLKRSIDDFKDSQSQGKVESVQHESLQIYEKETMRLGSYIRIMFRIRASLLHGPRTYHAFFPAIKGEESHLPIYLYTDKQYKGFEADLKVKKKLPKGQLEDSESAAAFARSVKHQEYDEGVIKWVHENKPGSIYEVAPSEYRDMIEKIIRQAKIIVTSGRKRLLNKKLYIVARDKDIDERLEQYQLTILDAEGNSHEVTGYMHTSNDAVHMFVPGWVFNTYKPFPQNLSTRIALLQLLTRRLAYEVGKMLNCLPTGFITSEYGNMYYLGEDRQKRDDIHFCDVKPGDRYPVNEAYQRFSAAAKGNAPDEEKAYAGVDLDTVATRDFAGGPIASGPANGNNQDNNPPKPEELDARAAATNRTPLIGLQNRYILLEALKSWSYHDLCVLALLYGNPDIYRKRQRELNNPDKADPELFQLYRRILDRFAMTMSANGIPVKYYRWSRNFRHLIKLNNTCSLNPDIISAALRLRNEANQEAASEIARRTGLNRYFAAQLFNWIEPAEPVTLLQMIDRIKFPKGPTGDDRVFIGFNADGSRDVIILTHAIAEAIELILKKKDLFITGTINDGHGTPAIAYLNLRKLFVIHRGAELANVADISSQQNYDIVKILMDEIYPKLKDRVDSLRNSIDSLDKLEERIWSFPKLSIMERAMLLRTSLPGLEIDLVKWPRIDVTKTTWPPYIAKHYGYTYSGNYVWVPNGLYNVLRMIIEGAGTKMAEPSSQLRNHDGTLIPRRVTDAISEFDTWMERIDEIVEPFLDRAPESRISLETHLSQTAEIAAAYGELKRLLSKIDDIEILKIYLGELNERASRIRLDSAGDKSYGEGLYHPYITLFQDRIDELYLRQLMRQNILTASHTTELRKGLLISKLTKWSPEDLFNLVSLYNDPRWYIKAKKAALREAKGDRKASGLLCRRFDRLLMQLAIAMREKGLKVRYKRRGLLDRLLFRPWRSHLIELDAVGGIQTLKEALEARRRLQEEANRSESEAQLKAQAVPEIAKEAGLKEEFVSGLWDQIAPDTTISVAEMVNRIKVARKLENTPDRDILARIAGAENDFADIAVARCIEMILKCKNLWIPGTFRDGWDMPAIAYLNLQRLMHEYRRSLGYRPLTPMERYAFVNDNMSMIYPRLGHDIDLLEDMVGRRSDEIFDLIRSDRENTITEKWILLSAFSDPWEEDAYPGWFLPELNDLIDSALFGETGHGFCSNAARISLVVDPVRGEQPSPGYYDYISVTVQGLVFAGVTAPIEGIQIALIGPHGEQVLVGNLQRLSNGDAEVRFPNIPEGPYTLRLVAPEASAAPDAGQETPETERSTIPLQEESSGDIREHARKWTTEELAEYVMKNAKGGTALRYIIDELFKTDMAKLKTFIKLMQGALFSTTILPNDPILTVAYLKASLEYSGYHTNVVTEADPAGLQIRVDNDGSGREAPGASPAPDLSHAAGQPGPQALKDIFNQMGKALSIGTDITTPGALAEQAGAYVSDTAKGPYTLFVPQEFFFNDELARDTGKYGNRFGIEPIGSLMRGIDNYINNLKANIKAKGIDPNMVIALVPQGITEVQIMALQKECRGIRVILANDDAMNLKKSITEDADLRAAFRANTYALMVLARAIQEGDKNSAAYAMLSIYVTGRIELKEGLSVSDYIEAIAKGDDINKLLKGLVKPAQTVTIEKDNLTVSKPLIYA